MKLRNKDTGEIGVNDAEQIEEKRFCIRSVKTGRVYVYDSLAKLNEEWKDYIPKEPLIKDDKIISLLRPWIKFNKIEKAIIFKTVSEERGLEDSWFHIKGQDCNGCLWDIEIHASYSESVDKDYGGELVGIEELYGSEE